MTPRCGCREAGSAGVGLRQLAGMVPFFEGATKSGGRFKARQKAQGARFRGTDLRSTLRASAASYGYVAKPKKATDGSP